MVGKASEYIGGVENYEGGETRCKISTKVDVSAEIYTVKPLNFKDIDSESYSIAR